MAEYIEKDKVIKDLMSIKDDYLDAQYAKKNDEVFVALMRAYARVVQVCIDLVKKEVACGKD